MKEIVLEAQTRPLGTKSELKTLRQNGMVPGIAYGEKDQPMPVSVMERTVQTILHSKGGRNALINLKIGDNSQVVLIKEIQRHPITRALQHRLIDPGVMISYPKLHYLSCFQFP